MKGDSLAVSDLPHGVQNGVRCLPLCVHDDVPALPSADLPLDRLLVRTVEERGGQFGGEDRGGDGFACASSEAVTISRPAFSSSKRSHLPRRVPSQTR